MPLVHFFRDSSYVRRAKSGRFAAMGEKDRAWRYEFLSSLKLDLNTCRWTLWICRTMREFHVSPFSDGLRCNLPSAIDQWYVVQENTGKE